MEEKLKNYQEKANQGELIFINGQKIVQSSLKANSAFIKHNGKLEFMYFRKPYSSFFREYEENQEICELYNNHLNICDFFNKIDFICFVDTQSTDKNLYKYDSEYFKKYVGKFYKFKKDNRIYWLEAIEVKNHNETYRNESALYLKGFYYRNPTKCSSEAFFFTDEYFYSNDSNKCLEELVEISKKEYNDVENCYENNLPLKFLLTN